ncbi:MAG: hypothetical protein HY960_03190 [Ignavibacteriae bacterium]|nr:hypothetical protein [Ignavibacteriota bacterium]
MPDIKNLEYFEPSRDAKLEWLGTRKEEMPIAGAGIKLPGLFSTSKKDRDQILLILIIMGELFGAWRILEEGGMLAVQVLVPLAIVADIIFAILLHRKEAERCRARNELADLEFLGPKIDDKDVDPNDPAQRSRQIEITRQRIKMALEKGKILDNVFITFIILIAIGKTLGFMLLYEDFDVNVIAMAVIYITVAVGHIKITGFWYKEMYTTYKVIRDYKRFTSSGGKTYGVRSYKTLIKVKKELKLVPYQVRTFHYLEKVENDEGEIKEKKMENVYMFKSQGMLTDEDLHAFISIQPEVEQKSVLAKYGLRHQLDMLNA